MKNVILAILTACFALTAKAQDFKQLKEATVMITDKNGQTGGTGTIVKSTPTGSTVLTNFHICAILEEYNGGLVVTTKGKYAAKAYVKDTAHDLCLIKVASDLGINTEVADSAPVEGDAIAISGHPYLIPQTVTYGHLSGRETIELLFDTQKCTAKDYEDGYGFLCWLFDGMPVIREFESRSVSATIAPGNSGSGVFNSDGKLVGVAFAGVGRGISYGFIVPYEYVKKFMNKKHTLKVIKQGQRLTDYFEGSKSRFVGTRRIKDLKSIDNANIKFPAIFNRNVDNIFEAYQCAQSRNPKCLVK